MEDVASTYTMVGAEGANVCVCDGKHFHLSKMCTPMGNELSSSSKRGLGAFLRVVIFSARIPLPHM